MEHKVRFCERLKKLMEEKNLSRRRLEEATGLSNQVISYWLLEKRVPSLHSLDVLADYFGVTIDYPVGRQ